MSIRRTIKRINPGRRDIFDDQLWPVIVALCVLSAIGIGAIVTLLSGPWMWGSLLVLPALTAGSLFLLSRMDDSRLRRTLQFSLIISLAGHLLILIIASLISIFNNPFQPQSPQIAKRKVRTIQFSSKDNSIAIPVRKPDDTPEPEVEIERRETQVTTTEQPIPVPQTEPTISPQTVRRKITRQTIPRFSESMSELRRSETPTPPQPKKVTVSKTASATPPSETKVVEPVTASAKADRITRSAATSSDVKPAPNPKVTIKPPKPNPTLQSEARRRTVSNEPQIKPSFQKPKTRKQIAPNAAPSSAIARVKRPKADLRNESAKSEPKLSKPSPATAKAADLQPAESSGRLTRRPRRNEIASDSKSPSPLTRKKLAQPRKADIQRRQATPTKPSITNPLSSSASSRLATADAPKIQSMTPESKPVPNPTSAANTPTVEARTLSISKSQTGVAGIGTNQNLQSGKGGLPSPAVRPSDAAMNRRTESRETATPMLNNSQASEIRRALGQAPKPSSAFKADTSAIAKISGSKQPSTESVESSAAEINSASSREVSKISVEQGAAPLNLGPTKVVEETQRRKLSGGGSPEVANLNPNQTRRSSRDSDARPSIAAADVAPVAAPRQTAAQPRESESEQEAEVADTIAKFEGEDVQDLSPTGAPNLDPTANQGTKTESQLAALRREQNDKDAQSQLDQMLNELLSGEGDDEEDDEEERRRKQLGRGTVRIARAPTLDRNREPNDGGATGDGNPSLASNDSSDVADDQGGTESDEAQLSQRSESSGSSSTADLLSRTATQLAVSAITNLPVTEGAVMRRGAKSESKNPARRIAQLADSTGTDKSEVAPTVDMDAKLAGSAQPNRSDTAAAETTPEISDALSEPQLSRSTTESESNMKMDVAAIAGPVGLSDEPAIDVGVATRPAAEDSKQLQPDFDTRFRNPDFGGAPAMNPNATLAKEAFRRRSPGMAESPAEPKTEAAIHLGLEFLARHQQPDGSWSLTRFDTEHPLHKRQLDSDMAATGLAVLAFQGAGYNHREFKYARQINHALEWLKENQADDGLLYLDSDEKSNNAARLYSHGIAALALTEAYGMTQDPELKEPAQRALNFIAETQHPTKGGWRYFSQRKKLSTDTSVTGWMVMALQSGRLSGLEVQDRTFESIMKWMDVAADPVNESLYRYNPYAVNSQGVSRIQGRNATPSMTAVGLLMRVYTGWKRDDPRLLSGARYLVQQQLPGDTKQLRDTYYWYYATQVLKHVDGPEWTTWNNALRPMLIRTQEKTGDNAGSWDPYDPVPDRWGAFGGRLYVTTMNLLSLEVRHRLLPLYIETNKDATTPKKKFNPDKAIIIDGTIE